MNGVYIGVDGKARKIKGGYIGIDGKARKIKKGYVGDANGVARLCWGEFEVDPVFMNNDWDDIALACQLNLVPDSWAIGDRKTMTIGDELYGFKIIGKNHDDYSDGSGKAPLTLKIVNCYDTTYAMNSSSTNSGGWTSSVMRNTYLPDILSKMPPEVQTKIREVNKLTSIGSGKSTIETTADKLFLLSEVEIFGSVSNAKSGEGSRYAYYTEGNSCIEMLNSSAFAYWERSPYKDNSTSFCRINTAGGKALDKANNLNGVVFAFCF